MKVKEMSERQRSELDSSLAESGGKREPLTQGVDAVSCCSQVLAKIIGAAHTQGKVAQHLGCHV